MDSVKKAFLLKADKNSQCDKDLDALFKEKAKSVALSTLETLYIASGKDAYDLGNYYLCKEHIDLKYILVSVQDS